MKEEVKLHIYKPDLSTELELPYADGGIKAGFPSPAQDYIKSKGEQNYGRNQNKIIRSKGHV